MKSTSTKIYGQGWLKKIQPDYEQIEILLFNVISKTLVALLALLLLLIGSVNLFAQTPGTASAELDISNVRARINNGGDMFWDFANPRFEVPKGSGKNTIFAGSLWIGGLDASSQIHTAAQTYRQTGNDFWPGPIDLTNGTAAPSSQWDYEWKVDKSTIDNHIQHWSDAGYIVPQELLDWPANGTPPYAPILAPFVDINGNSIYEPAIGEFPAIEGDQATYDIFNDVADVHGETGGLPFGLEVHHMSYEINTTADSSVINSVFMKYEIGNRSTQSYHDVYLGLWIDFDLGDATDDYVGTDVGRNMFYAYNGDAFDGTAAGYGYNPPAQGVKFLSHPLTHTISYDNTNGTPNGNPLGYIDYYNYLKGTWLDGLPITYGSNGRDQGNSPCSFMYPDMSDPLFTSPWNEAMAGNTPGDRRMLGSIGPIDLPVDSFFVVDVAFIYARGNNGVQSSITALQAAADSIAQRYASGTLTTGIIHPSTNVVKNKLLVYPNPVSQSAMVVFDNSAKEVFNLKLMDVTGKVVLIQQNIKGSKVQILRGNLLQGVYTLLLQSDKNIYASKIVVQ